MNLLLLKLGQSLKKAPLAPAPNRARRELEEGLLILIDVLRALGGSIGPVALVAGRVVAALVPFFALGLFLLF